MRLKRIILKGEKMEWNKPVVLNYKNLKAIVEAPENKDGFTAITKVRNGKLYIEPFKKSNFKGNKLYVVAFTHKYLQDYKGKTQTWYKKQYIDFLSEQPLGVIETLVAITIGGWWNDKEQKYNVDLGVITTSKEVACILIHRYQQLSGWDLIKMEAVECN